MLGVLCTFGCSSRSELQKVIVPQRTPRTPSQPAVIVMGNGYAICSGRARGRSEAPIIRLRHSRRTRLDIRIRLRNERCAETCSGHERFANRYFRFFAGSLCPRWSPWQNSPTRYRTRTYRPVLVGRFIGRSLRQVAGLIPRLLQQSCVICFQ